MYFGDQVSVISHTKSGSITNIGIGTKTPGTPATTKNRALKTFHTLLGRAMIGNDTVSGGGGLLNWITIVLILAVVSSKQASELSGALSMSEKVRSGRVKASL